MKKINEALEKETDPKKVEELRLALRSPVHATKWIFDLREPSGATSTTGGAPETKYEFFTAAERWILQKGEPEWFFILPNGQLAKWDGDGASRSRSRSSPFQNMIASGTGIKDITVPPIVPLPEPRRPRPPAGAWRTLRETVAAWFHLHAVSPRPANVGHAWTDGLALPAGTFVRIERAAQGSPSGRGQVVVSVIATGASSGEAFQLRVVNGLGKPVRLRIPDGLVLQPLGIDAAKSAVAQTKRAPVTQALLGYCLDFVKLPPAPHSVYRVAEQALQQKFGSLRHVLQAARTLSGEGRLRPDVDAKLYDDAINQWALWTRLEKWNFDGFVKNFIERGKKNVQDMKRTWTKQMEDGLRAAAPGRWRDIGQVLELADQLEKAAASKPAGAQ